MQYYTQGPNLQFADEKKKFSRVGWAFFVFMVVSFSASIIISLIWLFAVGTTTPGWFNWTMSIVSIYGVAAPFCYLILRGMPKNPPRKLKLRVSDFIIFVCIAIALMYVGALIGTAVNAWISFVVGIEQGSPIGDALRTSDLWLSILYTGIIAPILEELFFRKFLIDRLNGVGDLLVIMTSGLFFGLFHGNIDQFFYATLLGMFLAYVYRITGDIRYPIFIHAIVNFVGGLIPTIAEYIRNYIAAHAANDRIALLGELFPASASMLMLGFAVAGAVFIFLRWRTWRYNLMPGTVPRGMGVNVALGNAGSIVFVVACSIMMILTILGF